MALVMSVQQAGTDFDDSLRVANRKNRSFGRQVVGRVSLGMLQRKRHGTEMVLCRQIFRRVRGNDLSVGDNSKPDWC